MRTSKIPPMEDLRPYVDKRKEASEKYGVTEKTILRWLRQYNLCEEGHVSTSHKLDMGKAIEIRQLHKAGKTIKELSELYKVTFSTIARIIQNITYHQDKEVADVKVIYNPNPVSSSVFAVFESE